MKHTSLTRDDIPGVTPKDVGRGKEDADRMSYRKARQERRAAAAAFEGITPHGPLADEMRRIFGSTQMTRSGLAPASVLWAENAARNGEFNAQAMIDPALPVEALSLESYTVRAHTFAMGVLDGTIPAGVRIRQICARHVVDLRRSREEPKFPYLYDPILAGKPCMFLECMPHIKGKWAAEKELITLQGWQALFVCMLYGWVYKDTGLRRYTVAMLFVGRKNAKSTLVAGLALYMERADGEEGPEILCGATTEDQAEIVFNASKAMLLKTPELYALHGLVAYKSKITCPLNNGVYTTMIGKPGDGANPHFAIIDEYHEHDTDAMVETMRTGMGAREQPILMITTTAGDDISKPCYEFYVEAGKILDGMQQNDVMLPFIFEPDREDDWDSDAALAKANPNLGISVFRDKLVAQRTEALSDPRKISSYKRKHLNIWVNAGQPWVNTDVLLKCADPSLRKEQFAGMEVGVGMDLSSKNDLTARVTCVPHNREEDGLMEYVFFTDVYLPKYTIDRPENSQYRIWREQKHLRETPGAIIDIGMMVDHLLEESEKLWRIQGVRFDPYAAQTAVPKLEGAGLMPVEVPQTVKYLSDPMKWLEALIDAGRVRYDGNPIFPWCFSNVEVQPDRNGNIFPRRNGRKAKIDVAAAAIMAFMAVYSGEPTDGGGFESMLSGGVISGG